MRSLTAHLEDATSPVRKFFAMHLPNTREVVDEANTRLGGASTIRPKGRVDLGTIGTAFDYRARYYFARTPFDQLVACLGARKVSGPIVDAGLEPGLPSRVVRGFAEQLSSELERMAPEGRQLPDSDEELIARNCLVLAWFEQCFRAGPQIFEQTPLGRLGTTITDVGEILRLAGDAEISDLCILSRGFYEESQTILQRPAICNPSFPDAPGIRADADIIIDGLLADFKCSINSVILTKSVQQLVGYLLLDQADRYHITTVGLYMARQRRWLTWPVHRLLPRLTGDDTTSVAQVRADFARVLKLIESEGL